MADRQFDCPPGIECGPGPECTAATCDLAGCADAEVCNPNRKRNVATLLVDRQLECPPGLDCGPGPVCTPELCDDPGCADAEACQGGQDRKRSAETDIVPPVCDICEVDDNGVTHCGCDTTPTATPKKRDTENCDICYINDEGVPVCGCDVDPTAAPKKREAERVCPLFCITTEDGETLCGCAAEDYEQSLQGGQN